MKYITKIKHIVKRKNKKYKKNLKFQKISYSVHFQDINCLYDYAYEHMIMANAFYYSRNEIDSNSNKINKRLFPLEEVTLSVPELKKLFGKERFIRRTRLIEILDNLVKQGYLTKYKLYKNKIVLYLSNKTIDIAGKSYVKINAYLFTKRNQFSSINNLVSALLKYRSLIYSWSKKEKKKKSKLWKPFYIGEVKIKDIFYLTTWGFSRLVKLLQRSYLLNEEFKFNPYYRHFEFYVNC